MMISFINWIFVDIPGQLKTLESLESIGMTTNGLTLTRQLPALQRAGLDAINISLDTLKKDRFEKFTRRQGWSRVIAAIDLAVQLQYHPVKVYIYIILFFIFALKLASILHIDNNVNIYTYIYF